MNEPQPIEEEVENPIIPTPENPTDTAQEPGNADTSGNASPESATEPLNDDYTPPAAA